MLGRFSDRTAAGIALGKEIVQRLSTASVVLGIPRGGVPVAAEVAAALGCELDALIVRKIGAPGRPELAIGAIAAGGGRVVNTDLIRHLGVSASEFDHILAREQAELDRRSLRYRGERPLEVRDRSVVIVDDGAATGASMVVALDAVRAMGPGHLTAAVPVASREAMERMGSVADTVIAVSVPEPFHAVGAWYDDFRQTSDDEVVELLTARGKD